ncbi:MAG: M28 family peptidase [Bacteroidales bacterium]|nr:M28 family peptidase [Bacteroidales bacterium]
MNLHFAIFSLYLLFSPLPDKVDSIFISKIYQAALKSMIGYEGLKQLTDVAPGRLAGSENSYKAIEFTANYMKELSFDTVFTIPCYVVHWDPGTKCEGKILCNDQIIRVSILPLGGSISTPNTGIMAPILPVENIEKLKLISNEQVKGKIVFFTESFSESDFNPFHAYGKLATTRMYGPDLAAQKGAIAAIIRSISPSIDTFPHTGITKFVSGKKIPAFAISTSDAQIIEQLLAEKQNLKMFLYTDAREVGQKTSYNVVGEIRGSVEPQKIITVGGHLDSWYNSPGVHDDGAGCMHAIEAIYLLKKLGYKPRYTLRAVMFMDEEQYQAGGKAYAQYVKQKGEKSIFAIESDTGGDLPLTITIDSDEKTYTLISSFAKFLSHYDITIQKGYGGVDIFPLKELGTPLAGIRTNPHRYFERQHSAKDGFETVHKREFQLGSALIASLIYLVDKNF